MIDYQFQSAPPHGGRRELLTHERQRDRVSIRAPARGATWGSEHKQSLTARGASARR